MCGCACWFGVFLVTDARMILIIGGAFRILKWRQSMFTIDNREGSILRRDICASVATLFIRHSCTDDSYQKMIFTN